MRKKQQKTPRTIADIAHLSASSIDLFETCPRRWANQYLYGAPRPSSRELRAGTAVHSLHQAVFGAPVEGDHWAHISEKEREAVVQFLTYLESRRPYTRAVEYEARVFFAHGAPPILLYIDRLEVSECGRILTIVDVKTNRRMEPITKWREKIQVQIYQWAVRQLWPGQFEEIRWRIEYALLGKQLEWVTNPDEDAVLVQRLNYAWQSLLEISQGRTTEVVPLDWFPEKTHQFCARCERKGACEAYQGAIQEFSRQTEGLLNLPQNTVGEASAATNTPEKSDTAQADLKAKAAHYANVYRASAALEREKKALAAELQELMKASGDIVLDDGSTVILPTNNQRHVSATGFIEAANIFAANYSNGGLFLETISEVANDLYTIKLATLDKLTSLYPEFKEVLSPHVQVVTAIGTPKVVENS